MPADKRLILAGLLAGAAALPVLAQESILPPGFGDPQPAAPTPAPAPRAAPSPTASPSIVRPTAPAASDMVTTSDEARDSLAEVPAVQPEFIPAARRDPNVAGLFAPAALGLGETPWGGAYGPYLQQIMRRMDTPLANRWSHIVLRSALLASGAPPAGANPSDWAAERAWLLLRMGEADGARMLVATLDSDRYTPKMVQVAGQAALATSDPSGLCPIQDALAKVEPRTALLVGAMCEALSGSPEEAASAIDRARNRGGVPAIDLSLADKVVGAAADSSRSATIEWEPVERLDSWRYGLATATGLMPPEKLVTRSPARVRAWLSRAPLFAPEARLAPARTAARLGVMSSSAYVSLQSAAYDRTDPDSLAETDAWKLRLAYIGDDLDTRMSSMRQLWGQGEGEDDYGALVLTARAASLVAPSADLSADAPKLVASMLAAGFDRHAARWGAVLADLDEADGDRVWAMLALGAPTTRGLDLRPTRVEDFIDRDDSPGKRRSALLVGALAGLGRLDRTVASEMSRRFELRLGGKSRWSDFIDGAAARRQAGTVILMTASAMQARSPKDLSGRYLFHSVAALNGVGLDFAARMIAAEALARS